MSTPKLSNGEYENNGRFCYFYRVGNKGYKVYSTKRKALACLRTQRYLYKMGVAPKPGNYFTLKSAVNGDCRYGYITDIADEAEWRSCFTSDSVRRLLMTRNIRFYDCADFNLGTYRNKPVIVDCDPEEFSYNGSFQAFRELVGA